jgi:BlaI family penicillinase repressor
VTVRDVHETIASRRPTQYTTVLKQMQVMAEKGLVRRNEDQRAHVYEAARPREWTQRQLAGDILQRAFNGSAKSLMIGALSSRKASKAELAELRGLLDKYERRLR